MKALLSIIILILNLCLGISQNYDLIVRTNGDSIACTIDSITDTQIYFKMKIKNSWAHTDISMPEVSEYKKNVIDKNLFVFETGSTYIKGTKTEPASISDLAPNSVYVGMFSVSYSRLVAGEKVGVTFSGGFSFVPTLFEDGIGIMVEATMLTGGAKHFFEPGIMGFIGFGSVSPVIRIGYRYQNPEGFMLRLAPLVVFFDDVGVLPSISVGYSF